MTSPEGLLVVSVSSTLIFTLTSIIGVYVVLCLKNKFSYWHIRGVPSVHPLNSLVYTLHFLFGREQISDAFDKQYRDLAGHKYGGSYQLTQPCLILRDPDTIRSWLIKGFSSFHDRDVTPDETNDELSGNLIQLTGERWRRVRHKLAPAFSSAKLKVMYQTLMWCAQELNAYFDEMCSETGETEVDMKDQMHNYTMEVIGACAMGIKCNAIRDPNCKFKRIFNSMFQWGPRRAFHTLLAFMHPSLPGLLGLKPIERESEQLLRKLCNEAIEMKTKEAPLSSTRTDFLQILIGLRSSELHVSSSADADANTAQNLISAAESAKDFEGPIFTENVLVGVISSFLAAGFDTVACALTFCLFELALHPEIQESIFKEIETVRKEVGHDLSFEDLRKLRYVEQVINESLRKYPVGVALGRNCTEPFLIPGSSVVVEKDIKVYVPTYSLHHDSKYFPEPEKFNPDRFSEENIHKIVPGSYLPFGEGPRFCIGMRLALTEVKVLVLTLVSKYTLHACAKTPKQLKFDNNNIVLSPKGGLWLRLKKRLTLSRPKDI